MLTREIAAHLAHAARQFPFLGISDASTLLEVVRLELGHEEILDSYQPYGNHLTRAVGPKTILHVISGNTPHAGLQSLIRGLLLKSRNLCKIPSSGLPEIAQFREALLPELANRIEISSDLHEQWLNRADALLVFGTDQTIEHFRRSARPNQIFVGHGHKVSFGVVFDDPQFQSVAMAARDFSLFDQQGCLSPHGVYVQHEPLAYAEKLAMAMAEFNAIHPRSPISSEEAAQIQEIRQAYRFRAAVDPGIRIWTSESSTDWTVIFDSDPAFTVSCLNRVAFVKPLPANLGESLQAVKEHLSTIGIWPSDPAYARSLGSLDAPRICPLGRMQSPPFTWHQDGGNTLVPLVKWEDWET